jgi:hypothetical protein
MKRWACVVMVGLAWTLTVIGVAINIRNGQRLSLDVYGWFLQGFVVGALSIAPVAVMSWAGYQWAGRRFAACIFGFIVALPLIFFNWWSSNEFMGDQMLGHYRAQEDRLKADEGLADLENNEVLRSRREAEKRLWDAWNDTKSVSEKARIKKELDELRGETPALRAATPERNVGARSSWLSKRLGWDRETIEGVTPTMAPILMQIVEVFFSLMGFASWPRGAVAAPPPPTGNQKETKRETTPPFTRAYEKPEALKDALQLISGGSSLENQKALAKRWGRSKGTVSKWLKEFERRDLIVRTRTGYSKVLGPAKANGNGAHVMS